MLNTQKFAQTLKKLRTEKGLSQPQLAEIMVVSRSTISMWELGKRLPDVGMLDRLARCLGVDIQVFLDAILEKDNETLNIIVVEDVPTLLNSSVNMIKDEVKGANVTGFESAPKALSFAKQNHVSIAFLDIELDEYMDGLELARHLKVINPYMDIIFLTNHTKYLEQATFDHCSGYILKPLTRKRIRHEMNSLSYVTQKEATANGKQD